MAFIDKLKLMALTAAVALALPMAADAATRKKAPTSAKAGHSARTAKSSAHAGKVSRTVVVVRNGRRVKQITSIVRVEPAKPSFGQLYGLHNTADSLELKSSVALVVDSETNEVLFSKNPQAVLPIASLTKLMTALVVTEAKLPLAEQITVTDDDIDTDKGSRSRLKVGTTLSREEMLHLALMSSENRAAHALGRNYPGGSAAFVAEMNRRAQELGMADTSFVEPTGLSPRNVSTAR